VRAAVILLSLLALGPVEAGAHDHAPGRMPRPHHRPSRPIIRPHPAIACCLGVAHVPPAPPPVLVIPPPPIYVVVPAPPSLVHVPTPRVDPAPEITLPTGRWARHGNGLDYPYVWVWAGPPPPR